VSYTQRIPALGRAIDEAVKRLSAVPPQAALAPEPDKQ
jgi:hypothetical protein